MPADLLAYRVPSEERSVEAKRAFTTATGTVSDWSEDWNTRPLRTGTPSVLK